jgi:hypothetical protein
MAIKITIEAKNMDEIIANVCDLRNTLTGTSDPAPQQPMAAPAPQQPMAAPAPQQPMAAPAPAAPAPAAPAPQQPMAAPAPAAPAGPFPTPAPAPQQLMAAPQQPMAAPAPAEGGIGCDESDRPAVLNRIKELNLEYKPKEATVTWVKRIKRHLAENPAAGGAAPAGGMNLANANGAGSVPTAAAPAPSGVDYETVKAAFLQWIDSQGANSQNAVTAILQRYGCTSLSTMNPASLQAFYNEITGANTPNNAQYI